MNKFIGPLEAEVAVTVFDCSGVQEDIRRGVEALLSPLHPRGIGIELSIRLMERKDTTMPYMSFRQRKGLFHLWFLRRDNGVVYVGEMRPAGLVGD